MENENVLYEKADFGDNYFCHVCGTDFSTRTDFPESEVTCPTCGRKYDPQSRLLEKMTPEKDTEWLEDIERFNRFKAFMDDVARAQGRKRRAAITVKVPSVSIMIGIFLLGYFLGKCNIL